MKREWEKKWRRNENNQKLIKDFLYIDNIKDDQKKKLSQDEPEKKQKQ